MLPGRRLDPAARRRPRAVSVIGAVIGGVVLAGCASGQVAQTANQSNNGGGADVTTNGILVRAAEISFGAAPEGAAIYPAGGSAPVDMHVINLSPQDDKLVSASSPVAASVQISGQSDLPAGVEMVVGGNANTGGQSKPGSTEPPPAPPIDATLQNTPGATRPPASSAQEPSDVSPTGSASPSGEAPAADLQAPPPIKAVEPSTRSAQVVLTGLREDIKAGLSYEIDLTFERAGVVRVVLPVAYPGQPRPPFEKAE